MANTRRRKTKNKVYYQVQTRRVEFKTMVKSFVTRKEAKRYGPTTWKRS